MPKVLFFSPWQHVRKARLRVAALCQSPCRVRWGQDCRQVPDPARGHSLCWTGGEGRGPCPRAVTSHLNTCPRKRKKPENYRVGGRPHCLFLRLSLRHSIPGPISSSLQVRLRPDARGPILGFLKVVIRSVDNL